MTNGFVNDLKLVYVLIDGVSDGISNLNTSPLESATTNNLDLLVQNGIMSEVMPVKKNFAPESDIAVFNMLGYNFTNHNNYPGRGVIEAIGSRIDFADGDVALRGNFATIDKNNNIIDRRAGRNINKKEAIQIANEIEDKITFSIPGVSLAILPTINHRICLRIRHEGRLSGNISNTDPAYGKINGMGITNETNIRKIKKCYALDDEINSTTTAKLINEFTAKSSSIMSISEVNTLRKLQNKKPMNCILTRDAGDRYPNLIPIEQKYGLKFSCVVDMPVEIGIAKVLKMNVNNDSKSTEYEKKAKIVLEKLKTNNVVYVHLKGPDEFGHDGDFHGKTKSIEEIDEKFFGVLVENVDVNKIAILVSADHSTPCRNKSHSSDPVPLLLSANWVKSDSTKRFTELQAKDYGSLKLLNGADVLKTAINLLNCK